MDNMHGSKPLIELTRDEWIVEISEIDLFLADTAEALTTLAELVKDDFISPRNSGIPCLLESLSERIQVAYRRLDIDIDERRAAQERIEAKS